MPDLPELRLPADATPDEAAAITAAVEGWLATEAGADAEDTPDDPWEGQRFAFASRLEKVTGEPARVPRGAPADPWSASGRRDRF